MVLTRGPDFWMDKLFCPPIEPVISLIEPLFRGHDVATELNPEAGIGIVVHAMHIRGHPFAAKMRRSRSRMSRMNGQAGPSAPTDRLFKRCAKM
jgi:hypothetical protein